MILEIDDRIRNTKIDFFNKVDVTLRYDSVGGSFSFDFYFDPKNQSLIDLACVGHYHIVRIKDDNELLLTGYILNEMFTSGSKRNMVNFSGYSLAGFFEDCNIPPDLYPLQSDGLSLLEITNKLVAPFDFGVVVDPVVSSDVNGVFDTTTASESQTIKSYLAELASQKNIILSHTPAGNLYYTRAKTNVSPKYSFEADSVGVTGMSLSFNGQSLHSHITVMKQASVDGGNAGQSTITNPFVPYVYRPKVVIQTSGTDTDTELAAKNALNQELKNIKFTINLDRWKIDGAIVRPNTIIEVYNPEIYLFQKTKLFIEAVTLKGSPSAQTATLTCVLPSIYDGTTSSYIFEGINTH